MWLPNTETVSIFLMRFTSLIIMLADERGLDSLRNVHMNLTGDSELY